VKRPYLTALLGGATISLIPTWLVAQVAYAIPALAPKELTIVSEFFSSGIGFPQITVFFIIVVFLPPVEEWLFRGVLWSLASKVMTPNFVWVTVSLLFALVHWEFLHVIGLLPLSFFLGWLRSKTGVLGPSTVAHMANNAMACLLMVI